MSIKHQAFAANVHSQDDILSVQVANDGKKKNKKFVLSNPLYTAMARPEKISIGINFPERSLYLTNLYNPDQLLLPVVIEDGKPTIYNDVFVDLIVKIFPEHSQYCREVCFKLVNVSSDGDDPDDYFIFATVYLSLPGQD